MNTSNLPPAQPKKQHVVVDYMVHEDSIVFTKLPEGTHFYKLDFNYSAKTALMASVYTFTQECFNIDTYTTEDIKPDPNRGCESMLNLNAGDKAHFTVPKMKIIAEEKYIYGEHVVNNFYPFLMRLVLSVHTGKQGTSQLP